MQQAKQLKETFLDPLKFDALLTTFGNAEGSMESADKIDDLAHDVLPEVLQQPEEDHLFQSLRTAVEGYPQPCLVVSDLGLIVALNGPAYTAFDLEVSDQIDRCGIETQDTVPLSTQIAQTMAGPGGASNLFLSRLLQGWGAAHSIGHCAPAWADNAA